MSYISGHYRKGHYRNGKWVSGGYVRSHCRNGLSYRPGMYSINTTATDTTEEWVNLITPQNMKIISGMMENFDYFSYARTLRFFEAYYPYDVEDIHYARVLLSMNICTSIDELISVRECIKEKIKKIDNHITRKLPKNIYEEISTRPLKHFNSWADWKQENLIADVNSCYDENVFRLFKEKETITDHFCGECFINLSYCHKHSKYRDFIIHEAKERANIDVTILLYTIAKRFRVFEDHWKKYKGFNEGMNGYNSAKKVVEDDFEYLKQFNWRLSPCQKSLYSEINREMDDTQDIFLNERREYSRRVRDEEGATQKTDIKKQKEKNPNSLSVGLIIIIIIIGCGLLGWIIGAGGA